MLDEIIIGDVRAGLGQMKTGSVQATVTSPPYWGLRDYGTAGWEGAAPGCECSESDTEPGICVVCGATRLDQQLGLEPTLDEYIANLVDVFREVRRVLRDDGTLWLNMGDAYASTPVGISDEYLERTGGNTGLNSRNGRTHKLNGVPAGLKPKDLIGQPWRLAFALQADGWYLRSDIIWAKPNPMPEPVTDRPTKSHEHIFLLTKQPRYYYDADAVRETTGNEADPNEYGGVGWHDHADDIGAGQSQSKSGGNTTHPAGRNKRDVWTVATQPYPDAHFATFPEDLIRPCILAGTSAKGQCVECGAPWVREIAPSEEHAERVKSFRTVKMDGKRVGQVLVRALEAASMSKEALAEHFPSRSGGVTGCVRNWVTGKNVPTATQWATIKGLLPVGDSLDALLDDPALGTKQGWSGQATLERGMGAVTIQPAVDAPSTTGWAPTCECNADVEPQTVLDPFMGSGTTAKVAHDEGRHYLGTELNPDYAALALERVDALQHQLAF